MIGAEAFASLIYALSESFVERTRISSVDGSKMIIASRYYHLTERLNGLISLNDYGAGGLIFGVVSQKDYYAKGVIFASFQE